MLVSRRGKSRHLVLGRRGERVASAALRELGIDILARNYVSGRNEIDLVGRHGASLCFIEVKTRRRQLLSSPASAVGREKKRHIGRAARAYIHAIGDPHVHHRYDIVEVLLDGRRLKAVRYWPNAFVPH